MKSLLFFFLCIVFLGSCKRTDKTPSPEIDSLQFGLNHQAPFRSEAEPVKLNEIFFNGKLVSKYLYTDGHLSELKKYVTYNDEKPWYTVEFKRNNGMLESYETKVASFSPEARAVADLPNPGITLKLGEIKNDSIVEYIPTGDGNVGRIYQKLIFADNGYVIRQEGYSPYPENYYNAIYERDGNNNIIQVTHSFSSSTPFKVNFRYDNHPNPYFMTGIYGLGDVISNYSLTPNNVIEETRLGVDDYRGYIYRTTYEYQYLPNGYPSQMKMERYLTKPGGKEEKSSEGTWSYTYY